MKRTVLSLSIAAACGGLCIPAPLATTVPFLDTNVLRLAIRRATRDYWCSCANGSTVTFGGLNMTHITIDELPRVPKRPFR